jgi:hypothetical protein
VGRRELQAAAWFAELGRSARCRHPRDIRDFDRRHEHGQAPITVAGREKERATGHGVQFLEVEDAL